MRTEIISGGKLQGELTKEDGYSTAVIFDQTGLDPQTGKLVRGGIVPQTERALENIGVLLEEAGARPSDTFQVDVRIVDPTLFADFNGAYQESDLITGRDVLPTRFTYVGEQEVPGALVTVSARAAFKEGSPLILKSIHTDGAAKAVAAYGQGIDIEGEEYYHLITSGQIGLKPEGSGLVEGGMVPEAKRVFTSIGAILEAGGASPGQLTRVDMVVPDPENLKLAKQVYRGWEWAGDITPKQIKGDLLLGASFEARCFARVPKTTTTIVDLRRPKS